jgi:hypothetical protein
MGMGASGMDFVFSGAMRIEGQVDIGQHDHHQKIKCA